MLKKTKIFYKLKILLVKTEKGNKFALLTLKQKNPGQNRDLTFKIQTYFTSTGTEILSQSMVKPFLLIL